MFRTGRLGAAVLALSVLGAACVETESPTAIEVEPTAAEARGGINQKDPGETIGDIEIPNVDIPASNGFIHVINALVLPIDL